jgi:hypothetical protein
MLFVVALASCRTYHLESRLTDQDGLVPADQFARYGREQAQEMAIGREFARAQEEAITYARTLPDVTDIQADPLGHRLTIRFRSGWLTMVNPIDDGKRGPETPGLPARAGGAAR